jgi:hypothetical protein
VVSDEKGFITRLDFAYPEALLAIPADSFRWHSRRKSWETDIEQRNRLVAAGWRVRPTTWGELKFRPDQFTSDIARLLKRFIRIPTHSVGNDVNLLPNAT